MIGAFWTFFKILFPFLKESVFKGQSFKKWLARNAKELVYITLLTVMLMICYSMFKMAADAHRLAQHATAEKTALQSKLDEKNTAAKADPRQLKALTDANLLLQKRIQTQTTLILQYQTWMNACGMDYQHPDPTGRVYPTCATTIVVRPTSTPKPRRPTTPKKKVPAPSPPKDDAELLDRVQDIWKDQR